MTTTQTPYNGLNGTILLNTGNDGITVGTIPGETYGYCGRDLRVTVDIRIEREERSATYETTEHKQVTAPLSISVKSNVWRPDGKDIVTGGATRHHIREVATDGTPGRFWTAETLTRLAELGDRWHLNTMQAGCAHQEVVWENSDYGRRPSLDRTPVCPNTGYRYGRAWLVEVLPAEVVTEVLQLLAGPIGNLNVYVHADLSAVQ